MDLDFTLSMADRLFETMIKAGYEFQTLRSFLEEPKERVVLLRHDVDDRPKNSLEFAKLQAKHGLFGTYYFRTIKQSFNEDIIREIEGLGHEVGYHYEEMDFANGDVDKAFEIAKKNIELFKGLVDLSTICMHGSPKSKWDNKDLWRKYDYRELGIVGEPYFDVNFDNVGYLTDTGRMWDGAKFSVRDKVNGSIDLSNKFHSTSDIMQAISKNELPDQVMFTFHPQRWNNSMVSWSAELLKQTV